MVAGLVAAGALAVDQVTKALAVARLERSPIDLGIVRLRVIRNPGGSFGLLEGQVWLFIAAAVTVTVVAVVTLARGGHRLPTSIGLGLVVGGAWGNIIDRMTRWPGAPRGRVVDFVDFKVWPVFNAADSAVVIGVAVLLLFSGLSRGSGETPGRRPAARES